MTSRSTERSHAQTPCAAGRIVNAPWRVDTLRANARIGLAAELPAAFVSDLLGISLETAVRWSPAAGAEWTNDVAVATCQRRATNR